MTLLCDIKDCFQEAEEKVSTPVGLLLLCMDHYNEKNTCSVCRKEKNRYRDFSYLTTICDHCYILTEGGTGHEVEELKDKYSKGEEIP